MLPSLATAPPWQGRRSWIASPRSFFAGRPARCFVVLALWLSLHAVPGPAAEPLKEPLDGLDAFVAERLAEWQVPGLAIVVVKDGAVVLAKGFGATRLSGGEPVTAETLFYLGSTTKTFNAALFAIAVDAGKINWDTPVREYFPEFRMFDPVATDKLTFRDLLCHRSGLPRQEFLKIHAPEKRTDLIDRIRFFEPNQDFRAVCQYCNETVTVAGDLLARRLEAPSWEDLLSKRLLEPLGLSRTVCSVAAIQQKGHFAYPNIVREEKPEEMAFYDLAELRGPAGGVASCAADLGRWLRFNLDRGTWDGRPLISAKALAQLHSPQMPFGRVPKDPELTVQNYCLGWIMDNYRGALRLSHPGNLYGFSATLSFLPRERLGVAVLTNLNGAPLPDIVERWVYDRLLGLSPVDWDRRFKADQEKMKAFLKELDAQPDPDRRPDTPLSHALEAYAGAYRNPGYENLQVSVAEGELKVRLHSGEFRLKHYNYDTFELAHPVEGQSWLLSFRSDLQGQVGSVSVNLPPTQKEIVFTRVPGEKAK